MISNEQVIVFLKNKECLTFSKIEKEAQLPEGTISKITSGGREFNAEHLNKLYPVLVGYGWKEYFQSKFISIVNYKDGVEKTTITINLGKALVLLAHKVLAN